MVLPSSKGWTVQKTLSITDVTEMHADRVCIAGVDDHGVCLRPVLPGGVRIHHLYQDYQVVVRPRARITFDLEPCPVEAPHVEDWQINPSPLVLEGIWGGPDWEATLRKGAFDSVESIFEGHLQESRWVLPGAPTRSLGTLAGVQIDQVALVDRESKLECRLYFTDRTDTRYRNIAVTDLTFRVFSDFEAKQESGSTKAARKITQWLQKRRVYLRLGLTRPWAQPGARPVCWMQVTAIHTFPDYLGGRTFPDFQI